MRGQREAASERKQPQTATAVAADSRSASGVFSGVNEQRPTPDDDSLFRCQD